MTLSTQQNEDASSSSSSSSSSHTDVSVAIIGSGFSGLCMAIQLKKAGISGFTVFEAADDVGGTWRDNTYPGCACDVASVLYSYSFEPYPFKQHYSGHKEIKQYLNHCADKYSLKPHLRLSTRVTGAVLDEPSGSWTLTTSSGEQHVARVLVLAAGGLTIPSLPAIPGLDTFPGGVFHTARWDHSVDLKGKRVAVVGTGASAIQIIPSIQPIVDKLTVFQRTPAWVLPVAMRRPKWLKSPAASSGWYNWLQRQRLFWNLELLLGRTLINNRKWFIRKVEALCKAHIRKQVLDPAMQEALTPTYSLGCKRILSSDVYYPALCANNAQLVASGVREVKGNTIIAEDGSTAEADVIVFATGFDLSAMFSGQSIKGRGGADLDQQLAAEEREEYLGLAAHNFPNLFTINGLNTGLGHNSMVFMAECGVNYIMKMVQKMQAGNLRLVEVRREAQHNFTAEVQRRLKGTVWLSGACRSWYQTADGQGSTVLWPGLCVEYWWRTLWPRTADWKVEKFDSDGSGRLQQQIDRSSKTPTAVVVAAPAAPNVSSGKAKEC